MPVAELQGILSALKYVFRYAAQVASMLSVRCHLDLAFMSVQSLPINCRVAAKEGVDTAAFTAGLQATGLGVTRVAALGEAWEKKVRMSLCPMPPTPLLLLLRSTDINLQLHDASTQGAKASAAFASTVMAIPQLAGFDWKLGVSLSSSNCAALSTGFVTIQLHVKEADGSLTPHTMELSLAQFDAFAKSWETVGQLMESMD
jgi:hypothetical protein|eukprot:COSAG01_NODE_9724_length_2361_cov_4.078249_1_plen_202_part_00